MTSFLIFVNTFWHLDKYFSSQKLWSFIKTRILYFWNPRNNENADHYISNIFTKYNWDKMYLIFILNIQIFDFSWNRFDLAKLAQVWICKNCKHSPKRKLRILYSSDCFSSSIISPIYKKSSKGHYLHIWLCSKHDHYIHHLYLSKAKLHKNINVYKLQLMNRHIHSCYICEKMFIYLFILAFWIFISIGTNNIYLAFIDDY